MVTITEIEEEVDNMTVQQLRLSQHISHVDKIKIVTLRRILRKVTQIEINTRRPEL